MSSLSRPSGVRLDAATGLAVAFGALVLALCTLPGSADPPAPLFPGIDKIEHAVAFAVFAVLWRRAGLSAVATALWGAAFGVFIEVWQHVLPIYRTADAYDVAADLVGLALGLGAWAWIRARRVRPPEA